MLMHEPPPHPGFPATVPTHNLFPLSPLFSAAPPPPPLRGSLSSASPPPDFPSQMHSLGCNTLLFRGPPRHACCTLALVLIFLCWFTLFFQQVSLPCFCAIIPPFSGSQPALLPARLTYSVLFFLHWNALFFSGANPALHVQMSPASGADQCILSSHTFLLHFALAFPAWSHTRSCPSMKRARCAVCDDMGREAVMSQKGQRKQLNGSLQSRSFK